jgi:serine phosphatase RsbU (regulator of sigma subunit)
MVCSLLFGVYLVFRWRTAALRERQKQLEKTVEERTAEVVHQKEEVVKQKEFIEEKQKEIIDSINYAKRIQQALLPGKKYIEKNIDRLKKE